MAEKRRPVTATEFWLGMSAAIATLLAALLALLSQTCATAKETRSERMTTRRANAAEIVDKLAETSAKLRGALESEKSGYFEVARCLQNGGATPACWKPLESIDYDALNSAWDEYERRLYVAPTYLEAADERTLITQLRAKKVQYFARRHQLLAPKTAVAATAIVDAISGMEKEIDTGVGSLSDVVTAHLGNT